MWTVPRILRFQSPKDRVCPTGTGHGHDRQLPTCVTAPSTENLDDPATTEVSQSQWLDRRGLARDGTETGPDRENPQDCRQGHKDRSQRHLPVTQKIQKFIEVPRIVQTEQIAQRLRRP